MRIHSMLFLPLVTLAMSTGFGASPTATKKSLPKAGDFVELGGDSDSGGEVKAGVTAGEDSAAASALAPNEKLLTGTVRIIRKIQYTEAFFKDINDSYIIPSGNAYPSIYTAFLESQKKGTAVSFKVNTKSKRVISIEDTPPTTGVASEAVSGGSPTTATGTGKNTGSK